MKDMNQAEIAAAYRRMVELPFPVFGKRVGDFPLYDSLLAGTASRAAAGEPIRADEVPRPDAESVRVISALREKQLLSEDEKYFLLYFGHLESLRALMEAEASIP